MIIPVQSDWSNYKFEAESIQISEVHIYQSLLISEKHKASFLSEVHIGAEMLH
jgi:hypothetical protein